MGTYQINCSRKTLSLPTCTLSSSQGGSAANHEVLLLPPHRGQDLWLAGGPRGYTQVPVYITSCYYHLTVSVIATLFGVCTSLGLGTMQINRGFHLLHPAIPVSTNAQLAIIWCITAVATGSVLTGNLITTLSQLHPF